ncbi:hypothetical protein TNCV_616951 [Trichonephila clavipes]|nr:hypothetical protein TNCV_616951 [Trichonephila clavipes]
MNKIRKTTAVLDSPTVILKEFVAEIFFMLYNHTTWPLSIFCIMKIHRLGPGSNPPPCVEKASDKPTTPPSKLVALDDDNVHTYPIMADKDILEFVQS